MDNTREWLCENGYEDVLTRIQGAGSAMEDRR